MPPKRRLPAAAGADDSSSNVRVTIRAVAHAFNQVLGNCSGDIGHLAQASAGSAEPPALRPSNHGQVHSSVQVAEHYHGMPVVAGVVASSAVPMSAPVIDHQQTYNVPMLDHMHSHSDDLQQVVHNEECPVRLSYPRCTQCHRCHNPARRCRCFSCGNMHYSSLPCVMSIAIALRCPICNVSHAPGPCAADTGPLAAHCEQCDRWHLPSARCRCRLCGALHLATAACNQVRAPRLQDVHIGAALSRHPVAEYDCGAPTEICPHCAAMFFIGEAQYLNCCRQGTIVVTQSTVPPHYP